MSTEQRYYMMDSDIHVIGDWQNIHIDIFIRVLEWNFKTHIGRIFIGNFPWYSPHLRPALAYDKSPTIGKV